MLCVLIAQFEARQYAGPERLWAGRYLHLQNLLHWHTECELLHVDQGSAVVKLDDASFALSQGQTIFVESGQTHTIEGAADSIVTVFLFETALIGPLLRQYALESPLLCHAYEIEPVYHAIARELENRPPLYELETSRLLQGLMIEVFRREPLRPAQLEKSDETLKRHQELLHLIETQYGRLCFADAARFMGLSEAYFSRTFKRFAGMTFSRYLNRVRVAKAAELLQSEVPPLMGQIAEQCGFGTLRHFNRVFKEVTGYTPTTLPPGFQLPRQAMREGQAFDPTLGTSILL